MPEAAVVTAALSGFGFRSGNRERKPIQENFSRKKCTSRVSVTQRQESAAKCPPCFKFLRAHNS